MVTEPSLCLMPTLCLHRSRGRTQQHARLTPPQQLLGSGQPSPGVAGPFALLSFSLAAPWPGSWPPGLSPVFLKCSELSCLLPRPPFMWPLPGLPPASTPTCPSSRLDVQASQGLWRPRCQLSDCPCAVTPQAQACGVWVWS